MEKFYGLENSANWGWDWFSSIEAARQAWKSHKGIYGHNRKPLIMARDDIEAEGL